MDLSPGDRLKLASVFCPKNIETCRIGTCLLECGYITFLPGLAGNVFYAAIFGILLIVHIILGVRHRTWGFMIGMVSGLALEILGYVGRLLLRKNPFEFNYFLM
jgi:hypothetical protein